MFKYFLDEEPDLFREFTISKIEWCILNICGGEESEWKWRPLRFFCLVVCRFGLFKNKHSDFSPAEFSFQQGIMEEEIFR